MDLPIADNPILILFLIVILLVALQPMWVWGGEKHPKFRFWGNIGLLVTIGGAILGIFISRNVTSFSILIGVPIFAICWSVIFLHYLWLVIRSCLLPMSVMTAIYFSIGAGFLFLTDIPFIELLNKSVPLVFFCILIGYVWTVARSNIVDHPWHFNNPIYYKPRQHSDHKEEDDFYVGSSWGDHQESYRDRENRLIRQEQEWGRF